MNKKNKFYHIIFFCSLLVFGTACESDPPVPKPRTYPRMTFPDRQVQDLVLENCPFTFQFPTFGEVAKKKKFFKEVIEHDCWFDIHIPHFNANLYLSYLPVSSRKDYDKLVTDAYKINAQINKRSDFMEEVRIKNENGVAGMKFTFEGPAASPYQFFISDTTNHFLKGALYFNTRVAPDSLAPAAEFLAADIDQMLASFEWK